MIFRNDGQKDFITFVDYQNLRKAHPGIKTIQIMLAGFALNFNYLSAWDIWYFIGTATDSEFREQHLEECLKEYYEAFKLYNENLKDKEGKVKVLSLS